MAEPPAIVVHNLAHALAALAAAAEAGVPIRLESAPGAAAYAGAAWFAAVVAAARRAHPRARALAVLDCGAEAGLALGAIREGVEAIRTRAPARVRRKLAAIAGAAGTRVVEGRRGAVLDLLDAADPAAAATAFLARRTASGRLQIGGGSAMSGRKKGKPGAGGRPGGRAKKR